MGKLMREFLPEGRVYVCASCHVHLASHEQLVSKSFQGRHGRAYLFNEVVNVDSGPVEQRELMTGLHAIADLHCSSCSSYLGWRYENAFEQEQKYKVGKCILEKARMVKGDSWS
eukprot:m.25742 g.25742  ORF g.25742 m.25742 type:complete len:114 (-) comp4480_c0_seq1:217-558(-)